MIMGVTRAGSSPTRPATLPILPMIPSAPCPSPGAASESSWIPLTAWVPTSTAMSDSGISSSTTIAKVVSRAAAPEWLIRSSARR